MRKTKTYKVKVEFVREKDEVSTSLRPGRKLKKAIKNFMKPLGIDPEAMLALLAEQAKRAGKIPVETVEVPNRKTLKAMKETE